MAGYRDLTGDYAQDVHILRELLQGLTTEINIENQQGEVIDHSFVGTGAEIIPHGLGKIPTLWREDDKTVAGTVYRSAWDKDSITLVSSDATQVLRFYVE